MSESPENSRFFRDVLGHCSTAVTVVTAPVDDGPHAGMVVGSFMSVSLDPPLVAFLPAKSSTTWPKIEKAGKFCANVMAQGQGDICGKVMAKDVEDKFEGLDLRMSTNGSPILSGCLAYVDCDIEDVHDAGDHVIVVGRVKELAVERPDEPLLFFQGKYRFLTPLA